MTDTDDDAGVGGEEERVDMADSDSDDDVGGEDEGTMPSVKIFVGYKFVKLDDDSSDESAEAASTDISYSGRGILRCKPEYAKMKVDEDGCINFDGRTKLVLCNAQSNECLPASFRSLMSLASPGLVDAMFPLSGFGAKTLPNIILRFMAEETIPCVVGGKISGRLQPKYYVTVTNARPKVSGESSRRKRKFCGLLKEDCYEPLGHCLISMHVRYITVSHDEHACHSKLLASMKFTPDTAITVSANKKSDPKRKMCDACHLLRNASDFTKSQCSKQSNRQCKECQESVLKATTPTPPSGVTYTGATKKKVKQYSPKIPEKLKAVVVNSGVDATAEFQVSSVPSLYCNQKESHSNIYQKAHVMEWLIGVAQATSTIIELQKMKSDIVVSYNRDFSEWKRQCESARKRNANLPNLPALPTNFGHVLKDDLFHSHLTHLIVFADEVVKDLDFDDGVNGSVQIEGLPRHQIIDVFGLDGRRLYFGHYDELSNHERLWNAADDSNMNVGPRHVDDDQLSLSLDVELTRQTEKMAEMFCGSDLKQSDFDEYRQKDRQYRGLLEQLVASRLVGKVNASAVVPVQKGELRNEYRKLVSDMKQTKAAIIEDKSYEVGKRVGEPTNVLYQLRSLHRRCISPNQTVCNYISRVVMDGTFIEMYDETYSRKRPYVCQSPSFRVCCAWCKEQIFTVSSGADMQLALSQAMGFHHVFECKDLPCKMALGIVTSLDYFEIGSFQDINAFALRLHSDLILQMTNLVKHIRKQADIAFNRSHELTAHANRSIQRRFRSRSTKTKTTLTDSSMTNEQLAADQELRNHWTSIKLVDTDNVDEVTKQECFQNDDAKHFWNDSNWKQFYIGKLDYGDNDIFVVADWLPASPLFTVELNLSNLRKNTWHAIPASLREKLVYSADDYAKVLDVHPREVCKVGREKLFQVTFRSDWIEIHTLESFQRLPKANLRTAARKNEFNRLIESLNVATVGSNPVSVPDEFGMSCGYGNGEDTAPVLVSAIGNHDAYKLRNAYKEVEFATLDMLKESIQPADHPDIRHFFRCLKVAKDAEWVQVPKGSRTPCSHPNLAKEDGAFIENGPPLPYRHNSISNLCAFGAAANVLATAGDLEGGRKLWAAAKMNINQLENTLRIPSKKRLGRYELLVMYLRQELKYVVKKLPSDYDALVPSESAKIVEIVGSNDRCAHVVGIVGSVVLDGNRGFEMPLTKAALDWCAGGNDNSNSAVFSKAMGYIIFPSNKTWKAIQRKDPDSMFGKMQLL